MTKPQKTSLEQAAGFAEEIVAAMKRAAHEIARELPDFEAAMANEDGSIEQGNMEILRALHQEAKWMLEVAERDRRLITSMPLGKRKF